MVVSKHDVDNTAVLQRKYDFGQGIWSGAGAALKNRRSGTSRISHESFGMSGDLRHVRQDMPISHWNNPYMRDT